MVAAIRSLSNTALCIPGWLYIFYVSQDDHELMIFLLFLSHLTGLQVSNSWSSCLCFLSAEVTGLLRQVCVVLGTEFRTTWPAGRHSTRRAASPALFGFQRQRLSLWPRLALRSLSSFFSSLRSAGITGVSTTPNSHSNLKIAHHRSYFTEAASEARRNYSIDP